MYDYNNKSNRKQVKETVSTWSQNWLPAATLEEEVNWTKGPKGGRECWLYWGRLGATGGFRVKKLCNAVSVFKDAPSFFLRTDCCGANRKQGAPLGDHEMTWAHNHNSLTPTSLAQAHLPNKCKPDHDMSSCPLLKDFSWLPSTFLTRHHFFTQSSRLHGVLWPLSKGPCPPNPRDHLLLPWKRATSLRSPPPLPSFLCP